MAGLEIVFLPSVGIPDAQKAIEFLAPMVAEAWHDGRMRANRDLSHPEQDPETDSGDSVA